MPNSAGQRPTSTWMDVDQIGKQIHSIGDRTVTESPAPAASRAPVSMLAQANALSAQVSALAANLESYITAEREANAARQRYGAEVKNMSGVLTATEQRLDTFETMHTTFVNSFSETVKESLGVLGERIVEMDKQDQKHHGELMELVQEWGNRLKAGSAGTLSA